MCNFVQCASFIWKLRNLKLLVQSVALEPWSMRFLRFEIRICIKQCPSLLIGKCVGDIQ